jgi:hypothetical protein
MGIKENSTPAKKDGHQREQHACQKGWASKGIARLPERMGIYLPVAFLGRE